MQTCILGTVYRVLTGSRENECHRLLSLTPSDLRATDLDYGLGGQKKY